jgi:hypothetical protein
MLCLSLSNIAGGILSATLLPHTIPIDRNQKTEANADRHHFPSTMATLIVNSTKNQRADADRQHGTEIIPRCAGMHHRIGAKLRPWQLVSATCGLSFPR